MRGVSTYFSLMYDLCVIMDFSWREAKAGRGWRWGEGGVVVGGGGRSQTFLSMLHVFQGVTGKPPIKRTEFQFRLVQFTLGGI